jgi:hypothetical protein
MPIKEYRLCRKFTQIEIVRVSVFMRRYYGLKG